MRSELLSLSQINYWRARLRSDHSLLGYIADPVLVQYFDQIESARERGFEGHFGVFAKTNQKSRRPRSRSVGSEELGVGDGRLEIGSPRHPLYFTAGGHPLPAELGQLVYYLEKSEGFNQLGEGLSANIFTHDNSIQRERRAPLDFYRGIDEAGLVERELAKLDNLRSKPRVHSFFEKLDSLRVEVPFRGDLQTVRVNLNEAGEANVLFYFRGGTRPRVEASMRG